MRPSFRHAGQKYLIRFCAQLYDAGNRYRYLARLAPGFREGAYEEHKKDFGCRARARYGPRGIAPDRPFRRTGDMLRDRFGDLDSAHVDRKA